jgi:hypothetical protein
VPDRDQASTGRCDIAARPELLAHVLSGALPLDAATMDHIRTVYREGQKQSRRDHAFGLVGDSLTNAAPFMHPFTTSQALAVATREPLSLSRGGSVVDLFRTTDGSRPSSYEAPRAAKDGVRASWPLQQHSIGGAIPIDAMISAVSPAYAVVLFGANDALFRTDSLPALRNDFTAGLSAIVDALERRGVIPLLSTVPKHMRERGWPDCPSATQRGSNEVFAAQATALSAAVAEVACQRHVPLIDLRWALDPLQNHGVGPDGVHLSVHPSGGAILDNAGLQCGYNVRNLVTLRELALVVDAVDAAPATSTRAVPK